MTIETVSRREAQLSLGVVFTTSYETGIIASGGSGTATIGIRTGSRPVVYMERTYEGTMVDAFIRLYETTFTGGTELGVTNRNFTNTTGTPPAQHFHTITGTPSGGVKASIPARATSSSNKSRAMVASEGEWYILKANTDYILEITNEDTSGPGGSMYFRFTFRAE